MIYPIVEGLSHGGRSVDWLRDKIFFGPDMMYLKCANPLSSLLSTYVVKAGHNFIGSLDHFHQEFALQIF